jgi:predicted nucleotidyltransferase
MIALSRKELEIIDLFRKDLFRKETIRGLMKSISKSSYPWVFNAVKKFIKERILLSEKKGKSTICSINLDSLEALYYLSLLDYFEALNARHVPFDQVKELIDHTPSAYFSFIVTGSYAEKKQTKESDVDITVIIGDEKNKKRVYNYLFNKGDLMIPKVHPFVFTKDEFLQMLLDKEENFGKLLYRKRLIYFGAENYYWIIKEAILHGFRG